MPLNSEQREAVRLIKEWELINTDRYFILDGAAGVGKTYTLSQSGLPFTYTAPTNKAVKVLASNGVPYPQTIHQLLGLKMEPDGAIRKLKQRGRPPSGQEIVVVDEASMISSELLAYIERQARKGTRFLFLGDKCQLPPVNEANSPIWRLQCPHYTLTEQMRQNAIAKESGLADYLSNLRKEVSCLPEQPLRRVSMPTQFLDAMKWQELLKSRAEIFRSGEAKIIAWRNVRVAAYNKLIRGELFGKQSDYALGDRVLLKEPAFDPFSKSMIAPTDTEGSIIEIDTAIHPLGFLLYKLTIQGDSGELFTFYPIHPKGVNIYKRELKNLANSAKITPALWGEYWSLRESVSEVAYAYSITAHKSQGSTYTNAYIDWYDIWLNRNRVEAGRCFYVAVSRAKERVYYGTI